MCRTHLLAKINVNCNSKLSNKALEDAFQARIQGNLLKGMPMISVREIRLAMEITFVKTLPYNHINIVFSSTLTFRSLTYHLLLTWRGKLLGWRLREAGPIASYWAQQCVFAHQLCSGHWSLYVQSQVLHRKTHLVYLNVIVFIYWCVLQHTVRLTRPIKVHTYSMTSSTLIIPNSRMGHSWG